MVILLHWQVNLAADHDVTPTLRLCLMGFNPFLLCAMPAPPADVPGSQLSLGWTFLHWLGSAALPSGVLSRATTLIGQDSQQTVLYFDINIFKDV